MHLILTVYLSLIWDPFSGSTKINNYADAALEIKASI